MKCAFYEKEITPPIGDDIYPGKLLGETCIEPGGGRKLVKAVLKLADEMAANK